MLLQQSMSYVMALNGTGSANAGNANAAEEQAELDKPDARRRDVT
jgi:hypothetical protein